jgi:dTDP-4-amino-4,6-dideoxygalactose transaminase
MSKILAIAKQYKLPVIEDAAQAVGSNFLDETPGSFGEYACFSLNPMKVFAACGEAGIVVFNSEETAKKLTALRYNGMIEREVCMKPSLNGRMDKIQAAMLLERFPLVDTIVKKRREIADFYNKTLSDFVITPTEKKGEYNNYYTYIIQTDRRDDLISFLTEKGIETKIHHRILMSQQTPYHNFAYTKPANAEKIVRKIVSLPCHEKMNLDQAEYVTNQIKNFFA